MKRLYLILRTDLASMTRGRCAAQAAHGANQFIKESPEYAWLADEIKSWEAEAGSFGTTITLDGGTEEKIRKIVDYIRTTEIAVTAANLVIDPEYMLKDGDFVHTIPNVLTGAYVFTEPGHFLLSDLPML